MSIPVHQLFDSAKLNFKAGRYSACISECLQILNQPIAPEVKITVQHLIGEASLASTRWEDAVLAYTELLSKNPNDAIAYANRGYAYVELKKIDLAISDYRQAITYDGSDMISLRLLGECYLSLGKADEAISLLVEGIQKDCTYGPIFRTLGEAYLSKRKWIDAYKAFKLAVALNSADEVSKKRISQLAKAAGD